MAGFEVVAGTERLGRRFEVIAHRGFSARAPENTLAAFEEAIACGAHRLEFDVELTRDGVPVVLHDESLERTTGSKALVSAVSYAEIQGLDAGSWFHPRFRGERIPSLEQVLLLCRGRVPVNIELKAGPRSGGGGVEARVLEALHRHGDPESAILSSFDRRLLARAAKLDGAIAREMLHDDARAPPGPPAIRAAKKLGCVALNVSQGELAASPPLVALAHAAGLRIKVYTVDDPDSMRRLLALGVDGIFTNRPDELLALTAREFPALLGAL